MKNYNRKLNRKLIQSIDDAYPIGLAQGQIGISIYFYYLSRMEESENYKAVAEQLLDDALGKLCLGSSLSVEDGLAGVALGVAHLIKAGFVEGEVNVLLEDIDNVIFKHIAFLQPNASYKKEELLHLLYYLYVRLIEQTDEDNRYIFCELIRKAITVFSAGLEGDFFNEPLSFSVDHYYLPLYTHVCARLLEQGFYNERIYKILEEFEPEILSQFPILHANRLYLLCGMLPLVSYMQNPRWIAYVDLLRREISLPMITEREMKNKHIFVGNGLSGVYLLLHYLKENYPEYMIAYNPQEFYSKIISSEAWESLFTRDYFFTLHSGLLNGFPGVQLVLSHLQKHSV